MNLQQHMNANGFEITPQHVPINQHIRFPGVGKKFSNRAGWAIQSETGLVTYGDFATGSQFVWITEDSKPMTLEQKRELSQRIAKECAKAERVQLERQKQACREVSWIWGNQTADAPNNHGYLIRKQSEIHSVKVVDDGPYKTALIVPVVGTQEPFLGVMQSAQFIFPDGRKQFYPAGKVANGYWEIQWIEKALIVIAEGFATGATLAKHYTPDCSVLIAFNANNLLSVARAFREANPDEQIIIAGDNDWQTMRKTGFNPGKEKAIQAAQAVNGSVSIPEFAEGETGSDWNDRYLLDLKRGV